MDTVKSFLNKKPEEAQVTKDKSLTKDQKEKQDRIDKERYAVARLKELQNLWRYFESRMTKNRQTRKAFRRQFITDDNFALGLIQATIEFYDKKQMQPRT